MSMGILLAEVHVWCPWRSEEDRGSSGTEVMMIVNHVDVRTEPRPLQEQCVLLTAQPPSLQPHFKKTFKVGFEMYVFANFQTVCFLIYSGNKGFHKIFTKWFHSCLSLIERIKESVKILFLWLFYFILIWDGLGLLFLMFFGLLFKRDNGKNWMVKVLVSFMTT